MDNKIPYYVRHSRAGGNPVDNKIPYKELLYRLDSRLRGNDEWVAFCLVLVWPSQVFRL